MPNILILQQIHLRELAVLVQQFGICAGPQFLRLKLGFSALLICNICIVYPREEMRRISGLLKL